jgi:hypothetical protein
MAFKYRHLLAERSSQKFTSTNLTGLSYVTQLADAKGIDPFSGFNNITPREGFSGDNKSLLV